MSRLPVEASLAAVERNVIDAVRKQCRAFNNKKPEVICIAFEHDPRTAHMPVVASRDRAARVFASQNYCLLRFGCNFKYQHSAFDRMFKPV